MARTDRIITFQLGGQPFRYDKPSAHAARRLMTDAHEISKRHNAAKHLAQDAYGAELMRICDMIFNFLKNHVPDIRNAGLEAIDAVENATADELVFTFCNIVQHASAQVR